MYFNSNKKLEKSRQLLKRLRVRDTYKFVKETIIDYNFPVDDEEKIKVDILSCADNSGNTETDLKLEDFEISSGTNNYAFKDRNPVDCVKFYNKNNIKSNI